MGPLPSNVQVCHIAAKSLGGADHPDNYYLASEQLNKTALEKMDYLNAILVGRV